MNAPHTPYIDDFPGEGQALPSVALSIAETRKWESLRDKGEQALIEQLLPLLQTAANTAQEVAGTLITVAEFSLLGQWGEVFCKAFNHADFLEWADARNLQFSTLKLCNGVLEGLNRAQTPQRFTLADDSQWSRVANPIVYIGQLLDPAGLGMPYLGNRVRNALRQLSLAQVLAFYGYPLPANRLEAWVVIDELQAAQAFPAIDEEGLSRSLVHAERRNQQRDYWQLADLLQQQLDADTPADGFAVHTQRLHLGSNSLLARSLSEGATWLKEIADEHDLDIDPAASTDYYFDHLNHTLTVLPRHAAGETSMRQLRLPADEPRWKALTRYADICGTDIYPDQSISISALLQAYGIERPLGEAEIGALIRRLRDMTLPAIPTLYAATRSLDERFVHSRYIGLLNDRHAIRNALYATVHSGALNGPQGLDAMIDADADTLHPLIEPGRLKLVSLTQLPEFVAVRATQNIAPNSHILLSASGGIGGFDKDGHWKLFTEAVMANPRLADKVRELLPQVIRLGGQLRTNKDISLVQALRLYNIPPPGTLEEARLSAQRRAITAPQALHESDYWRALKPPRTGQPVGWTLSDSDRIRVISLSRSFLPDTEDNLFDYLSRGVILDKSVVDIRAEADLLMIRLIATPRAQQLATHLKRSLQWHGSDASEPRGYASRSALIWAALILSLDPAAGAHPTRLNALDWSDSYFWSERMDFVRAQIEGSFRGLQRGTAALAAHLMLSAQAPYLLVRRVPGSMPFLSTQSWVLFHQYATYLEQRTRGAARQMDFNEVMYLAYLPAQGSWAKFLDTAAAVPPILGWAIANGILQRQARYSIADTNLAISALNAQRARLESAIATFSKPPLTLRNVALDELRAAYPPDTPFEDLVFMWLPTDSPFSEDGRFDQVHVGPKYSLVDLYMAGQLQLAVQHWHSSVPNVKYRILARRFKLLSAFNRVFAPAFDGRIRQVQAAYVEFIQSAFSTLTLPRREALEYGRIECFTLRRNTGAVGRFGLLVCVLYYSDRHIYEFFPKYLLMHQRRDLDYIALAAAAAGEQTSVASMAFDWPAYATGAGAEPAEGKPTTPSDLRIERLSETLPAVEPLPPADAEGLRVPRSLDSPRSHALATILVERHFLLESNALREQAERLLTLDNVSSDADPWRDYLQSVALALQ